MKIGVLTFHKAHNYGAVLQALALQKALVDLGHSVKFIDYVNNDIVKVYKIIGLSRFISKNPFKVIFEFYILPSRFKRFFSFNEFIRTKLNLDSDCSYKNINNNYEAIIVGSDQVWNFHLTNGFDPYYWGGFRSYTNKELRVLTYAVSLGIDNLSMSEKANIAELIKNFDQIGVRELSLSQCISKFSQKKISVVADPTLLLETEFWTGISKKPKLKKPYLLLYQVRNSERNIRIAEEIAEKYDLEIIYLSAIIEGKNSKITRAASPEEFVGLFKNADFVVCSSFHGTVFSILFNIPFFSILMDDGRDARSLELLESLGLKDRAIRYLEEIVDNPIDWNLVKLKLNDIRSYSINYLKRSLG